MIPDAVEVVRCIARTLILGRGWNEIEQLDGAGRTWRMRANDTSPAQIVKLFRSYSGAHKRETSALIHLKHIGKRFPIPTLLHSGALHELGASFIVMTELEGCTLHRAVVSRVCDRKAALFAVGQLLARLHRATIGDSIGSSGLREEILTACEEHTRLLRAHREYSVEKLSREVERRIAAIASSPWRCVSCHGDLHLQNVIVIPKPHRVVLSGVIDFELACASVPEFDVAKSIVVNLSGEHTDEDVLISGYGFCELSAEMLDTFKMFHVIEGWLYGRLIELRDRHLWDKRLQTFTSHFRL